MSPMTLHSFFLSPSVSLFLNPPVVFLLFLPAILLPLTESFTLPCPRFPPFAHFPRAVPKRRDSPPKEAEATDYMRGMPDTRENSRKQAKMDGADMQTQFALKMGQVCGSRLPLSTMIHTQVSSLKL